MVDKEDEDEEPDIEDEDAAKVLKNFRSRADKETPTELAALAAEEKCRRRNQYKTRITHIVRTLQETISDLPWDKFSHLPQNKRPVTIAWWRFLRSLALDKAANQIIEAAPETAQLVLGGPLTREELLMLPSNWEGVVLWGVYVDILTGKPIENEAGMEPYTGSATGKEGLQGRMSEYVKMKAGTKKNQGGEHCDLLTKKNVKINLRVVSVFGPHTTAKPYVMLSELTHTILLRTWEEREGKYLPIVAMEAMKRATPPGLPPKRYIGLNRATQMLQGLEAKKRGGGCANCAAKTSDKDRWFNALKGLPFMTVICRNCYQWTFKYGTTRPTEKEEQRVAKNERPKPADMLCERPGCSEILGYQNATHVAYHFNKTLGLWTCVGCKNSKVLQKTRAWKNHPPKPADDTCERPNCPNQPVKQFNKHLNIWVCSGCNNAKTLWRNFAKGKK